MQNIELMLKEIYDDSYRVEYLEKIKNVIKKYDFLKNYNINKPSHETAYLITYGDSFYEKNIKTLETLEKFIDNNLNDVISDVHILPMFPYTSDDGFSVTDYRKVDEKLGDFSNLLAISKKYGLMYDFVVNHISQSSEWFKKYLENDEKYNNYFIAFDEKFDYSKVVRPRTSNLISNYANKKTAWTTFSQDQVDLNFKNIEVLVETTDILLEYIEKGATSIRLDAIGFLWKESGSTCIHLKQTHLVIKLWRYIFDMLAPHAQIITETNVPHKENISYFGNGNDEAHQVYQFALPPLVLHTIINGNCNTLSLWAKKIDIPSNQATFFNFLASHDGIGMRPIEEILSHEEKNVIFEQIEKNGGKFNYKSNDNGTKSVYEMNITFFDALRKNDTFDIDRFICAHAIQFAMPGVPAIYYNSIIGSINDLEGVEVSGINRRINRQKFELNTIEQELKSNERRNKIHQDVSKLLKLRKKYDAFNPYGEFEIDESNDDIFSIIRYGSLNINVIVNITDKEVNSNVVGFNVISEKAFDGVLKPYQVAWIVVDNKY